MSVCIVISLIYIKQIKNHTRAIRQCVLLVENIRILIEYRNLSIEEIFDNISASDNYDLLIFIKDLKRGIDNQYYENLNKVLSTNSLLNYFDSEDIDYLKGFFSMLGRSDTNGQIMNCDLYKNLFEKKLLLLEGNENNRCKSTATLTMGLGMLFSIIVI